MIIKKDTVIIGGGPAGMAAAAKLAELGVRDIVVLEKEDRLGGVLPQCIHDGFGVLLSGVSYTGTEFSEQYAKKVRDAGIEYRLWTTVTSIEDAKQKEDNEPYPIAVKATDDSGDIEYRAKTVLLTTGCREKNRGSIAIPGSRAAGIYTAGTAQAFINLKNLMPGSRAVILGSGDIGLIVARRITLEGGEVACVVERDPVAGGLQRNVNQCLEDYGIPLYTNTTVTNIYGGTRVTAVDIAEVDGFGNTLPETVRTIPCDTLILSVGLVPSDEIVHTDNGNVFVCGNAAFVHDLVDRVVEDAEKAAVQIAGCLTAQPVLPADRKKKPTDGEVTDFSLTALADVRAENRSKLAEKRLRKIERAKNNQKTITCILCPNSCEIDQNLEGGKCLKGAEFVRSEIMDPRRILTSSVLVKTRGLVSVRTTAGIPKEKIGTAMEIIRSITLERIPVFGQIVYHNFIEKGIDLIVTR